ncbi:MAG TPA: hypothetical protein VFB08_13845 [Burkholderiales bacterium]|nr:hypothetical protein [Burkholderiales bacterium]
MADATTRSQRDQALSRAIHDVLGERMALMLHVLASGQREPGGDAQGMLMWLKENMPRTADKVVRRLQQPGS